MIMQTLFMNTKNIYILLAAIKHFFIIENVFTLIYEIFHIKIYFIR